ncbi:glycosyltransferase family 25 protein [Microbulbifer taiwanensis]|uniref:glycosyltransferase family 25 protein n=1 Tax=Microbulbifer taiwanensis TaxID=986746 RepID=UPI00361801CB
MNQSRHRRVAATLRRSFNRISSPPHYRDLGNLLINILLGRSPAPAGVTAAESRGHRHRAAAAKPERARRPHPQVRPRKKALRDRERPSLKRPTRQLSPYAANTPCWVITLAAEGESARSLMTTLKKQRLPACTIAGVDGRNGVPTLEPGERIANATTRWRHLCELKNSEVGCYLAHLRAIRRAYESGLERVCILEDDVHLEPEFGRVLAELEQLPEEVEMVRLMGLKVRKRRKSSRSRAAATSWCDPSAAGAVPRAT